MTENAQNEASPATVRSTHVELDFNPDVLKVEDTSQPLSQEQQFKIMKEAIGCSPDELCSLDISQYADKLRIITNTEPEIVDEYLPAIISQFEKFLAEHPSSRNGQTGERDPFFEDAFDIGNSTRHALWLRTHGKGSIDPDLLQKAYDLIYHDSNMVRHFAIEFSADLARLDSRVRDTNDHLDLWGRMKSGVVEGLLDFSNVQGQDTAVEMIETFWAEYPSALP